MRQFHWKYQGYNLFTCAADLAAARKVFSKANAEWAWQNPTFFQGLANFVETAAPFESATEYPIVTVPEGK